MIPRRRNNPLNPRSCGGSPAVCECFPQSGTLSNSWHRVHERDDPKREGSGQRETLATFSSAVKRPSLRDRAAGPESPFSGSAPFSFGGGLDSSESRRRLCTMNTPVQAHGHTISDTVRRDAPNAPEATGQPTAIYSRSERFIFGLDVGALLGCTFYWVLLRG